MSSAPSLTALYDLLKSRSAKWDDIGRTLGVDYNEREKLVKNVSLCDCNSRLETLLAIYIETKTPTWSQFIQSMEESEYNAIAIEAKLKLQTVA